MYKIIFWFSVLICFTIFALWLDSFFNLDLLSPLYAEGTDLEGDLTKDQLNDALIEKKNQIASSLDYRYEVEDILQWQEANAIRVRHEKFLNQDVKSISKVISKLPQENVDKHKASTNMERIRSLDSIRPEPCSFSRFMDKFRKK